MDGGAQAYMDVLEAVFVRAPPPHRGNKPAG